MLQHSVCQYNVNFAVNVALSNIIHLNSIFNHLIFEHVHFLYHTSICRILTSQLGMTINTSNLRSLFLIICSPNEKHSVFTLLSSQFHLKNNFKFRHYRDHIQIQENIKSQPKVNYFVCQRLTSCRYNVWSIIKTL